MPKRPQRFYLKNEADVMRDLGLTPTKGSGSGWVEKEDGYNDKVLAQLKSTDAKSIRIQLLDVEKLELNANTSHRIPVFVVQFLQTGDIFLMARPMDIPDVAQYIECGECNVPDEVVVDVTTCDDQEPKLMKVKTGNRKKFWADRAKEWERGKRS